MTGKRKRQEEDGLPNGNKEQSEQKRTRQESSPKKSNENDNAEHEEALTPSKPRRGRPPGSNKKTKATANSFQEHANQRTSPSKSYAKGKLLFATPRKIPKENHDDDGTPGLITQNVDRSARRKSARRLIERTITDLPSEEEELDEGGTLARKIWSAEDVSDDSSGASDHHEELEDELGPKWAGDYTTPSKREPKQHKRARRKKSLTPPQDLAPHEEYFYQNRLGRVKSSSHTLSPLPVLTHEQYHNELGKYKDPHASSLRFLQSLHSRSFPQWSFELAQSFSICLYGYGSKRRLVTAFANYLHSLAPSAPPLILVVNGYTPALTLRQILILIASQLSEIMPLKLPSHPVEAVATLITHLKYRPPETPVNLFVNSLDASPLRRAPTPMLLAQLAASPHIRILATCDQPNFPLLWDTSLLEQYNWIYHDTTTFVPYGGVEIPAVVDDVNELLGRSGRTVKGKEGVGFVLRSLPENARNLYRVLIAELLAADAEGDEAAARASDFEDDVDLSRVTQGRKSGGASIDYRVLYQKVVEEFICSNEMAFRQLLKEFHDHQMVVSRKDGMGGELLGVPFMREEMEGILEDLIA